MSGTFAIKTEHAAELKRHEKGLMTYYNPPKITTQPPDTTTETESTGNFTTQQAVTTTKTESTTKQNNEANTVPYLNISWLGFQDAHSNISKYFVKLGTTYHGCELCNDVSFHVNTFIYFDIDYTTALPSWMWPTIIISFIFLISRNILFVLVDYHILNHFRVHQ